MKEALPIDVVELSQPEISSADDLQPDELDIGRDRTKLMVEKAKILRLSCAGRWPCLARA